MFGTTFGFSLARRQSNTGGGGGGEQVRWASDTLAQSAAFAAGALTINLSQTPIDADALIVYSEITPLFPGDYTYLTGPPRIRIEFAADPATDTDDGIWDFRVTYPYLL
jgi:hypothetical protein